jgi:hypothetical protein
VFYIQAYKMTVSFKQFSDFIHRTQGDMSEAQIDEAWADIFKKRAADKAEKDGEKDDSDVKGKVMSAKEKLAQKQKEKKEQEDEQRKAAQKKRDQAWLDAKERAENRKPTGTKPTVSTSNRPEKDEYQFHRTVREGKTSYSSEGYWKDDAKVKGYKVKKLSGNTDSGDQTWGAFDGDKKMGEFAEQDEGGWLMEKVQTDSTRNKNPGFFVMNDTDKVLKMDLGAAKTYLSKKVDSTDGANPQNTTKAKSMIAKASSVKKLAIDLSNFVLAHESAKNMVIVH